MAYSQAWIVSEQFQEFVLHRQNAPNNDRRLGIYPHRIGEDGRKTLVHSAGNLAVLLGSQGGKLAPSLVRFGIHTAQFRHRCPAFVGKNACRVGTFEGAQRAQIVVVGKQIARAVPPIVGDMHRNIARRGRCKLARRRGIGKAVACREFGFGVDFVSERLRRYVQRRQESRCTEQDKMFSHIVIICFELACCAEWVLQRAANGRQPSIVPLCKDTHFRRVWGSWEGEIWAWGRRRRGV